MTGAELERAVRDLGIQCGLDAAKWLEPGFYDVGEMEPDDEDWDGLRWSIGHISADEGLLFEDAYRLGIRLGIGRVR